MYTIRYAQGIDLRGAGVGQPQPRFGHVTDSNGQVCLGIDLGGACQGKLQPPERNALKGSLVVSFESRWGDGVSVVTSATAVGAD